MTNFRTATGSVAILCLSVLVSACGGLVRQEVRSHGPAIHGYGPISFQMPREHAFSALKGKGRWEFVPEAESHVLTYSDYLGYLEVKVVQHFSKENKATKAEVLLLGARDSAKTLNECRGLNSTVYQMLQQRYRSPDWDPRVQRRRYGESGLLMYTFADSSSISLNYDYVAQDANRRDVGLCTVKLTFNPPWA